MRKSVLDLWSEAIDRHPFKILFLLFGGVLVLEGVSNGEWLSTTVIFVISFTIALFSTITLKLVFRVERGNIIESPMDYRRPSGHSLISMMLSTVAGLMDSRTFLILLTFSLLTGYARVRIGAHKKGEVIEGLVYGLIIGVIVYAIIAKPIWNAI